VLPADHVTVSWDVREQRQAGSKPHSEGFWRADWACVERHLRSVDGPTIQNRDRTKKLKVTPILFDRVRARE